MAEAAERSTSSAGPSGYLIGALCICVGTAAFNGVDVIIKFVSGTYPLYVFLLLRGLATVPIMGVAVVREAGLAGFRVARPWLVMLRGVLLLAGSIAFALALALIPLADAIAIYFMLPLLVAGLAGPLLGERVPLYRFAAVLVGFIGVLVIVRPESGALQPAALWALAAALLDGLGQMISRLLPTNRTSAIAFYQGVAYLAGAVLLTVLFAGGGAVDWHPSLYFLTRGWETPAAIEALLMLSAGPLTAVAMWFYAHAYKVAPVSFTTSFEYVNILWAGLFGYLFFAEVPSAWTWTGAAIVIVAGLYLIHRDRKAGLL